MRTQRAYTTPPHGAHECARARRAMLDLASCSRLSKHEREQRIYICGRYMLTRGYTASMGVSHKAHAACMTPRAFVLVEYCACVYIFQCCAACEVRAKEWYTQIHTSTPCGADAHARAVQNTICILYHTLRAGCAKREKVTRTRPHQARHDNACLCTYIAASHTSVVPSHSHTQET